MILENLATQIRSADGFIFIAGEYNWGVQPGLKKPDRSFSRGVVLAPSRDSPAIWRPFGRRVHAATAWHGILSEMGMIVVSSSLSVGPISRTLSDKENRLAKMESDSEHAFVGFADDLSWWVEAAGAQRAKKAPPY